MLTRSSGVHRGGGLTAPAIGSFLFASFFFLVHHLGHFRPYAELSRHRLYITLLPSAALAEAQWPPPKYRPQVAESLRVAWAWLRIAGAVAQAATVMATRHSGSALPMKALPWGSKPVWRRYKHDRFCMPRVCVFTLSGNPGRFSACTLCKEKCPEICSYGASRF